MASGPPWSKIPTAWIRYDGGQRCSRSGTWEATAALKIYISVAAGGVPQQAAGVSRGAGDGVSYDDFELMTGLSRPSSRGTGNPEDMG